jgi:hypothetical protein
MRRARARSCQVSDLTVAVPHDRAATSREYAAKFTRLRHACPAGARTDARVARRPAGLLPPLDDSGQNAAPTIHMQQRPRSAQRIAPLRAVPLSHLLLASLTLAVAITDGDRP